MKLTPPQAQAVAAITNVRDIQCLLLTGEAGAGKSVVAHSGIARAHASEGVARFIVAATTGIAALEIGGATLDKHMGWTVNGDTVDVDWLTEHANAILKDPKLWKLKEMLQGARAMLVDEVSMLIARKLDNVDHVLRRVRRCLQKPFGGLKLIFVGDFFQLPPILRDKGLYDPDYHFAFQARVWKEAQVKTISLPGTQRQQDGAFAALLSRARIGRLTPEDIEALYARVLPPPTDEDVLVTYLFPKNEQADAKNAECLARLKTEARRFDAVDTLNRPNLNAQQIFKDLRAVKTVVLKVGAHVMLLINMRRQELAAVNVPLPEGGSDHELILANGSVGRVVRFARVPGEEIECPIVRFVRKHGKGVLEVPIVPHKFDRKGSNPREAPLATRIQLPLLLCYAISAHKSQGQTLETAVVPDLEHSFEPGMAYVMLSRVKALDQLFLANFDPKVVRADPRVLAFAGIPPEDTPARGVKRAREGDDEEEAPRKKARVHEAEDRV